MKFGQLIEYNMRNIFLEKSYTKWGRNAFPRPFSIKPNLSISTDHISIPHFFIVSQVEGHRNILKLNCRPLAFTSSKAFLKNKKRSGTILLVSFSAWFLKKTIFLVIFYWLTKFHSLVVFTSWDIEQYVYCIVVNQVVTS